MLLMRERRSKSVDSAILVMSPVRNGDVSILVIIPVPMCIRTSQCATRNPQPGFLPPGCPKWFWRSGASAIEKSDPSTVKNLKKENLNCRHGIQDRVRPLHATVAASVFDTFRADFFSPILLELLDDLRNTAHVSLRCVG